jgi:LDH2 family malate/lactate/ureidoglycolate dehydrogenase
LSKPTYYRVNRGDEELPSYRMKVDDLRGFCQVILDAAGFTTSAAELVADSMADAEARGISSHGVIRTRIYAERLRAGILDPEATPAVVKERAGTVHIDAGNAVGHVGAAAGMDAAMGRARSAGVGVAGVRNSNHCGTLSYFVRRAAEPGLVGVATTTAPVTMAYHGGRTRAVGTNPLAVAVPRRSARPIVLDMATSATARGKIIYSAQVGKPIPQGWAVNVDGRPTTDPAAALAGAVLPFAGPKGSGLAMMIDLLCGGLISGVTGDQIGDMYEDWDRTQRVSHLFIALDPDAWLGRDEFLDGVEEFVQRVRALPPAEGFDRVLLPGDIEQEAFERALQDGVVLSGSVYHDLLALAEELQVSVEPPIEIAASVGTSKGE